MIRIFCTLSQFSENIEIEMFTLLNELLLHSMTNTDYNLLSILRSPSSYFSTSSLSSNSIRNSNVKIKRSIAYMTIGEMISNNYKELTQDSISQLLLLFERTLSLAQDESIYYFINSLTQISLIAVETRNEIFFDSVNRIFNKFVQYYQPFLK